MAWGSEVGVRGAGKDGERVVVLPLLAVRASRETSRAIAYNTTAADVESALEALNAVDNVTVTGNAGGPWTVTFVGTHSNINVPQMGGDAAALMSGSVLRTISYAFDAANQLTSASDLDSAYAWTFDNVGRVLTTSNAGTPGVPTVVLTNTWNAASQLTSVAASIAGVADFKNTYTRDNLGRSTQIEQTAQAGGNSVHDKRVRLEYNGLDQYTKLIRENKPSGSWQEVVTSNFSYDTLNRLTGLDYERAGTDVFTPYSWTFDKLSRPTQLSGQDGTSGYGYDVNSQLVSADHSFQGDESYSFDLNGNRTMSGWETGANNRLLSDGVFDYAYDNEGNLISRTNIATGELREFLWDYRNRLIQVTDKDNEGNVIQVIKYVYDVFDLRIGRLRDTTSPFDFADAAIDRYVLDGGDVVLDFVDPDGNGSAPIALAKRYLHGEAVDQLFAQEDVTLSTSDPNRTLWFLTDDLGTVRDLMRGDGTIAAHYKFEAFGKPTSGDTSKTRFLFTSREFDPATGLQYNRARWYDPATGRWISEDPIGFAAGDANLSRYILNAPTMGIDPTGNAFVFRDRQSAEMFKAILERHGAMHVELVEGSDGLFYIIVDIRDLEAVSKYIQDLFNRTPSRPLPPAGQVPDMNRILTDGIAGLHDGNWPIDHRGRLHPDPLPKSDLSSIADKEAEHVKEAEEDGAEVKVDVGGEGLNKGAINENTSGSAWGSTDGTIKRGDVIPNLILRPKADSLFPLPSDVADKVYCENTPIQGTTPAEIARIVKKGGLISISSPKVAAEEGLSDIEQELTRLGKKYKVKKHDDGLSRIIIIDVE
jgi:RHS repeat-associated protein